jgi:hypothetical protein
VATILGLNVEAWMLAVERKSNGEPRICVVPARTEAGSSVSLQDAIAVVANRLGDDWEVTGWSAEMEGRSEFGGPPEAA